MSRLRLLGFSFSSVPFFVFAGAVFADDDLKSRFSEVVAPFLAENCLDCHYRRPPRGGRNGRSLLDFSHSAHPEEVDDSIAISELSTGREATGFEAG